MRSLIGCAILEMIGVGYACISLHYLQERHYIGAAIELALMLWVAYMRTH